MGTGEKYRTCTLLRLSLLLGLLLTSILLTFLMRSRGHKGDKLQIIYFQKGLKDLFQDLNILFWGD